MLGNVPTGSTKTTDALDQHIKHYSVAALAARLSHNAC